MEDDDAECGSRAGTEPVVFVECSDPRLEGSLSASSDGRAAESAGGEVGTVSTCNADISSDRPPEGAGIIAADDMGWSGFSGEDEGCEGDVCVCGEGGESEWVEELCDASVSISG